MSKPICSTCNDTHRVARTWPLGDMMCTRCPTPCQKCRQGGNGPYCEKTPCSCECHVKKTRLCFDCKAPVVDGDFDICKSCEDKNQEFNPKLQQDDPALLAEVNDRIAYERKLAEGCGVASVGDIIGVVTALRARVKKLEEELLAAARSLESVSDYKQFPDDDVQNLRAYAQSRAGVARVALSPSETEKREEAYCCHTECSRRAEWALWAPSWGRPADSYTHACAAHVVELGWGEFGVRRCPIETSREWLLTLDSGGIVDIESPTSPAPVETEERAGTWFPRPTPDDREEVASLRSRVKELEKIAQDAADGGCEEIPPCPEKLERDLWCLACSAKATLEEAP